MNDKIINNFHQSSITFCKPHYPNWTVFCSVFILIRRLTCCSLTANSCEKLASALQSANLPLKELDLSNNNVQDSGVELLCTALKSPNCKLEILRWEHWALFTIKVTIYGFIISFKNYFYLVLTTPTMYR